MNSDLKDLYLVIATIVKFLLKIDLLSNTFKLIHQEL